MKKIIVIFITINLLFTNLYSKNNNQIELNTNFKKIELSTNELSKLYSKRFKVIDFLVKKANKKKGTLKMPDKIKKMNLSNDFKTDSIKINNYFSYQRKLSALIVICILTLDQNFNLEKDKKLNKQLDKLMLIEEKLKIASKRYNNLIDENKDLKGYPRIGGTKKTAIDFDINFN